VLEMVGDFLADFTATECGNDRFAPEGVKDGPGGVVPDALFLCERLLFFAALGLGLQLEALEGGASGEALALAQGAEMAEGFAKVSPAFPWIGGSVEALAGFAGQLEGEDGTEPIGDVMLIGSGVEIVGGLDETLDAIAGFLAALPVEESAFPPFGDVLRGNGAAVEIGCEDGLDFREPVEPLDDIGGLFAVVEAGVECVADIAGEPSDLAVACHVYEPCRRILASPNDFFRGLSRLALRYKGFGTILRFPLRACKKQS